MPDLRQAAPGNETESENSMSVCKFCGMNGHTRMTCYARPKNKSLKRKTMRRIGKQGQKWLMTRAAWFHSHAPDRDGFYTCYICGDKLLPRETTLDHVKSRSRHPELRFEHSNLQPCCWRCNTAKGSRDLDELEGGEIWTTSGVRS